MTHAPACGVPKMFKALKAAHRWAVYRLEQRPGEYKPTKVPYSVVTQGGAKSNDPSTWGTYDEALRVLQGGGCDGIAFFTGDATDLGFPGYNFFLFDFDSVRAVDTGEIIDVDAAGIINHMTGAGGCWEVSQSGTGFHTFGLVRFDPAWAEAHKKRWRGCFEFYQGVRFVALGKAGLDGWRGDWRLDWTDYLKQIVPVRETVTRGVADVNWQEGPRNDWQGPADDQALISTALKARGTVAQVFGTKATFAALWNASESVLAEFFPLHNGAVRADGLKYDASAADMGLMDALAYWTGCDYERMIRLFGASKLGARKKYERRRDLLALMSRKVINSYAARNRAVYNSNDLERRKNQQARAEALETEKEQKTGELRPVISVDEMLPRLRLVMNGTKEGVGVVDMELNAAWTSTQANAFYQASITQVPTDKIDDATGQPIVKLMKSLDLWRGSPELKWVHTVTWKPCKHGQKQAIVDPPEGRGMAYNLWDGLAVPPEGELMLRDSALRDAWVAPWKAHLEYLVPIQAERERFEMWLAHVLQDPGTLPQTAWLMWTEATGIGRNWLAQVLSQVLRGYVAAGVGIDVAVDAQGFNGRLARKLLATVDEAKAGMADSSRYQRAETLKSKINEQFREIDNKYGMKWIEYNCMRWLFFSNHADALPFDRNDRRINVVENPNVRQSAEYYAWIYSFVYNERFISAVWAHLMALDLSGFNPGEHAAMNAAKRTALSDMESPLVKALRDYAQGMGPDRVVTVRQIKDWITMGGELEQKALSPRALGHALKAAGFVTFPEKLSMRVGDKIIKESIVIINSERVTYGDLWSVAENTWHKGISAQMKEYLKIM